VGSRLPSRPIPENGPVPETPGNVFWQALDTVFRHRRQAPRLEKQSTNAYIKSMSDKDNPSLSVHRDAAPAEAGRSNGGWRVMPLEGAYDLFYCDGAGNASRRRLHARELKVGPGKTLLGGIDQATDAYRGFRADRIARVVDAETGETIERNVLDWLTGRAERQAKAEREAFLMPAKGTGKPGRRREKNPL
jgi:hypothetical protein